LHRELLSILWILLISPTCRSSSRCWSDDSLPRHEAIVSDSDSDSESVSVSISSCGEEDAIRRRLDDEDDDVNAVLALVESLALGDVVRKGSTTCEADDLTTNGLAVVPP
jgi:hypothetical protein